MRQSTDSQGRRLWEDTPPRVGARDSRPACSVTFPRGVGCAGPVAVRERSRDRSVRSPLRVSIADVCVCGARAPEVLSARSELSLSSAPSSGAAGKRGQVNAGAGHLASHSGPLEPRGFPETFPATKGLTPLCLGVLNSP